MTVLRKERANHPMADSTHLVTTELNGVEFLSLFRSSLDLFSANIAPINDLNVFPVPDGDTGTDMYKTLRDIVNESAPLASESVADTSRVMAQEALRAGRGNSGILLAAFFSGMAEALESSPRFGGEELTRALATASRRAYESIGHPVEGTILTVMRESAEAAESAVERDLPALMTTVCDAAMDSVVRTPLLLSALWDAGLVDSGGYGFYVMLEGIRRGLHRDADISETLQVPQAPDRDGGISPEFLDVIDEEESSGPRRITVPAPEFLDDIDEEESGFCPMADSTHRVTTELNGVEFLSLFRSSLDLFAANIPTINALNVFPVPDGDTGTNMYMTLRDIVNNSAPLASESVADTSSVMAKKAIRAGRGNSGILLAAFFLGMAEALESSPRFGGEELTRALATASRRAYAGIGHPREGTILTVMRESAEAAESAAERDLPALMTTVCDAAMDSVVRTPLLLSVLRNDEGVRLVDSGGYGFYVVLEGIRRRLHRAADVIETLPVPQATDRDGGISPESRDEIDEDESGFCTQFLVLGEGIDKEAVRARLMEFGTSPVVIGTSDAARIHVHTDEPQRALDLGHSLGEVSDVKVDDMDKQREFFSADRRAELSVDHVTPIAVVQGKGLEEVFKSLEVEHIVQGGDTMNPSVGDLLDAMEGAPTNAVAFLPNNPNIILAAETAAERSSKDVRVAPSRTVVQGIAAALEVHESASLGELVDNMTRRIGEVRTGEICFASRDAELGGVAIAEGQLIAMLDREIVVAADSVEDALMGLIERAASDDAEIEIVDLYWGDKLLKDHEEDLLAAVESGISFEDWIRGKKDHEAKRLLTAVEERFPEIGFVPIRGDQPHYHLFVSISIE